MKTLNQNEVVQFIRTKLKTELQKDFSDFPFRIFREKDLHTCAYYHLRHFLKDDSSWEILNEPLLRNLKGRGRSALPDIVLFHKEKPEILIELKFKKKTFGIQKKDQKVLKKSVQKLVNRAFFIQTIIERKKDTNRDIDSPRIEFIPIEMWKNKKEKYLDVYDKRRKPQPRKHKK